MSAITVPVRPGRSAERTAGLATRRVPQRRPAVVDMLAVLAGLGLGAVIAQWLLTMPTVGGVGEGGTAGTGSTANALLAAGQLTGLLGAYFALFGLLLAARIPLIETTLGQDRLLRTHRKIGPWTLGAMVAHIILVTLAYAATASTGPLAQFWALITDYEDVWLAAVGLALMLVAGIVSWRRIRAHLRYELWWTIHLTFYLSIALAFLHQVSNGAAFIGHPVARYAWIALYVGVFGCLAVFRVGLPTIRAMRHQLRVVRVVPEAPNVVSLVLQGRNLDRLPLAGGQFALWRVLAPGMWWQAHPYSFSGLRRGDLLRITVKGLGDHSKALGRIQPGTRVLMEGPYGAFTTQRREPGQPVLLIAGGVGIAPIRALLEDLPHDAAPMVLYRAHSEADLIFRDELETLLAARGGRIGYLVGDRSRQPITAHRLRAMVPDIARRSLYVCGPSTLVSAVVGAARHLGVPPSHIHSEAFDLHAD